MKEPISWIGDDPVAWLVNKESEGEKMETKDSEDTPHKCTACSCDYTDDEGGVQGDFGIMYMSFCPTCLSCMYDMVEQLTYPREELIQIMNRFGLATGHADTWDELLESLEIELEHKFKGDDNDGRC